LKTQKKTGSKKIKSNFDLILVQPKPRGLTFKKLIEDFKI